MMEYIKTHQKAVVFILSALMIIVVITLAAQSLRTAFNGGSEYTGPEDEQTLTYSNSLYSIDYKDPDKKSKDLTIKAYEGYRNAAIQHLVDSGVNPADYNITFNYENPFKNL